MANRPIHGFFDGLALGTRFVLSHMCLIYVLMLCLLSCEVPKDTTASTPEDILLKDFQPVTQFGIPVARIEKAKYPVIDMHTHGRYAKTSDEVETWVKVMDETGIEKAIVLTQDEHFYALGYFDLPLSIGYHWPMYGLGLDGEVLRKVYRANALKLLHPTN